MMKRTFMPVAVVIFLGILVAACTSPQTARQTLFDVDAKYQAALAVALTYESLPRCSTTQPKPCSDTEVVGDIRQAATIADDLLDRAEGLAKDPTIGDDKIRTALLAARGAVDVLQKVLLDSGLITNGGNS